MVFVTNELLVTNRAFLVAAARAWNSLPSTVTAVNPAFVPLSPENSSIHRIFPIILSYIVCILS